MASRGLFHLGISKYIIFALLITMGVGTGIGYWYYRDTQQQLHTLQAEKAALQANQIALEGAIKEQKQSIDLLHHQREVDQVKMDQLSREYSASRKKVNDLRRTLSKHDIGYLASQKPKMVEDIINRATMNLGKEIETLSQPGDPNHD